jgi:pheromone shutdown-related protein TraB
VFAFVILTFVAVLATMNSEIILKAFLYWFLINGILSAIGALIAGAHPLSALAAFLSAWLTSLNPMIAAGWVSGIVEAKIRKPTSQDLEELTMAESLRDLMRNRIFRILLVAALTNVGSMIGTIYGAYVIMQLTGINIPDVVKDNLAGLLDKIIIQKIPL